jgi:hypothetical protein
MWLLKTLHPVCSRERSLEERANDVVGRANDLFNFTILGRGIGTGHAKDGALSEEERAHGGVIEFSPIVTLNYFHSATRHRKKGSDSGDSVRFHTEGKRS